MRGGQSAGWEFRARFGLPWTCSLRRWDGGRGRQAGWLCVTGMVNQAGACLDLDDLGWYWRGDSFLVAIPMALFTRIVKTASFHGGCGLPVAGASGLVQSEFPAVHPGSQHVYLLMLWVRALNACIPTEAQARLAAL